MEVINDLLNYNGLKIVQNPEWFSFSLDSVLLASFVKVNNDIKIIDFCTGNAPIPLFLSTKTTSHIVGIELQKEVFEMAMRSVVINGLEEQIEIINEDINKISKLYETDTFDLITCNPPYFKISSKKNINDNDIKAIARHEIKLKLEDVFRCARKLLKNNGKIAMVHRTERLVDIVDLMRKSNIEPKRIRFIYPFKTSDSNLVLIEGAKNGNPGMKVEDNIIIHEDDGEYTKEVKFIFNGGRDED